MLALLVTSTLTLGYLLTGPCASPEATLRVQFAESQVLCFRVKSQSHMNAQMGTLSVGSAVDYEQSLVFRGLGSDSFGNTRIEVEFGRVQGTITWLDNETAFDSDSKEKIPPLVRANVESLTLTAGKSVHVTVDASGRIRGLSGWAAMFKGSLLEQTWEALGRTKTDEDFHEDAQALYALLPEKIAQEGAQWTPSYPISQFDQTVVFQPRCTLIALTDEHAEWTFATVAGLDDQRVVDAAGSTKDASEEQDPVKVWMDAETEVTDASFQGNCVVSVRDGLPVHQVLDIAFSTEMPNPLGAGDPIPTRVAIRHEIERTESPCPSEGQQSR